MVQKMRPDGTPYNVLEQNLKRLGLSMLIFSIYDLAVALLFLLSPTWLVADSSDLVARQEVYMVPLIHLVFPCFCILAWMDPKRNIVIVAGAIVARTIYAAFMFGWVLFLARPPILALLGGVSLAFAIIHYVLLRLSDFGLWEVFSRAGNPPGMRRQV